MKVTKLKQNCTRFLVCASMLVGLCLLRAEEVSAQWTTPTPPNTNINNTNTGNVGVGTSSPAYKLDITNALDKAQIRFGMGAFDSGGFLFSNAPSHAVFSGGASWDGGWVAKSVSASFLQANTGSLMFFANNGLTPGNGFTPIERMRISASGYLGIGTTNPTSKLHIVSGTDSGTTLLSLDTGVHGGTSMAVFGTANNESGFDMSVYRAGQYYSRFGVTSAGNVYLQSAAGNVGIGTSTPTYRFEVVSGSQWVARFKKTDATNGGILVDSAAGYNPNIALSVNGAIKWYMNSNATSGDALQFWEATGTNARLTMTQAGTVGIGTATPNALYKLDVAGQVRSSSGGFVFPDGSVQTVAATGSGGSSGWTDGGANVNVTNSSAKVGIGTTNPLQRIQIGSNTVAGTATPDAVSLGGTYSSVAGANPKLRLFDNNAGSVYGLGVSSAQFDFMTPAGTNYVWSVNGVEKMRLNTSGDITVAGNIAAKYQDIAEWVESSQGLTAGTVVVLDHTKSNQVIASREAYDTRVAGVISSQPGITLGEKADNKVLVATTGRVKVKVDASSGPIQVGDLLVTSDIEGVAKKSEPLSLGGVQIHRPGTLIGKALEPLDKGTGEILVLLSLQ
jgi:hypothetical protein